MNNLISLIDNTITKPYGITFSEEIILLLFKTISKTKNLDEAKLIFNFLGEIQFILARNLFKNERKMSIFLKEFITDFDRIDDIDMRNYLYKKIKSNTKLTL